MTSAPVIGWIPRQAGPRSSRRAGRRDNSARLEGAGPCPCRRRSGRAGPGRRRPWRRLWRSTSDWLVAQRSERRAPWSRGTQRHVGPRARELSSRRGGLGRRRRPSLVGLQRGRQAGGTIPCSGDGSIGGLRALGRVGLISSRGSLQYGRAGRVGQGAERGSREGRVQGRVWGQNPEDGEQKAPSGADLAIETPAIGSLKSRFAAEHSPHSGLCFPPSAFLPSTFRPPRAPFSRPDLTPSAPDSVRSPRGRQSAQFFRVS